MSLSALIRKRGTRKVATAIPAIPATQRLGEAATVAKIATVAVANTEKQETASSLKAQAGGDTKSAIGNLATAIPAIPATQPQGDAATVARVATVAVANTENRPSSTERHERWLIRYPDRTVEVWIDPAATSEEVLASRPGAVDAEPIEVEHAPGPAGACTAMDAHLEVRIRRMAERWGYSLARRTGRGAAPRCEGSGGMAGGGGSRRG